jgi:hypothetical protein
MARAKQTARAPNDVLTAAHARRIFQHAQRLDARFRNRLSHTNLQMG